MEMDIWYGGGNTTNALFMEYGTREIIHMHARACCLN